MPFEHVLVLLKGYLGDAVMATPLLRGLAAQRLRVEVLTEKPVIALLEDSFPDFTFHVTERLEKISGMLRQAKALRKLRFDAAIVVNRSFRSALLTALSGIPFRVGHSTDSRGWLLTKSVPYDLARYEPESYLDLARLAGIDVQPTHPHLDSEPQIKCRIRERIGEVSVGIQPGARHPWKRIPLIALVQVAHELRSRGHVIGMFGGPEEKDQGQEFAMAAGVPLANFIGEFSLKESVAATSQLQILVGGDTGLMHIAAASGCPTITAFGPTSAKKWGHDYPPHQVLTSPTMEMSDLRVEEYVAAIRRVLG